MGLLLAAPAWAEDYTTATFGNMAHTLIRFGAIDPMDDALLDEYAMVTDCEIVESFYSDDFKWSQVRGFIRDSIKMNTDGFPAKYHYDAEVQLDRYDFKDKNFRFTDKTAINGVNTFNFDFVNRSDVPLCNGHKLDYFPTSFDMVIGAPVSIGGLPFPEQEAKSLLHDLDERGNNNRILYARFNMTVIHIDPLRKSSQNTGTRKYGQNGALGGQKMRIDARLDSVKFYEDPAMTKLVYGFTP
jgi:hypothetical protein